MKHKAKFMLLWSSYLYCVLCQQYTFLTEDVRLKNYQYEQGMQSGNDVIWRCCVLSNLECYMAKSHKNITLYCWFNFMLSEYDYIQFTAGLVYWIWTAQRSVDNHFNDNSTQKEQQVLTDALCPVCEDTPQLRSI